jgi:hypothetical protein
VTGCTYHATRLRGLAPWKPQRNVAGQLDGTTVWPAVEGFAVLLGCVLVGTGLLWGEAALFGRPKLQRYVEQRGFVLSRARWLPFFWTQEAAFKVKLEHGEQLRTGRAYCGGFWRGPAFSSRIEFDRDNERLSDG